MPLSMLVKMLISLAAAPTILEASNLFYNYVDLNVTISTFVESFYRLNKVNLSQYDSSVFGIGLPFHLPLDTCFSYQMSSAASRFVKFICNPANRTHPVIEAVFSSSFACTHSHASGLISHAYLPLLNWLQSSGAQSKSSSSALDYAVIDYNCNGTSNCHSIIQFSDLSPGHRSGFKMIQLPLVTQTCVHVNNSYDRDMMIDAYDLVNLDKSDTYNFQYECWSNQGVSVSTFYSPPDNPSCQARSISSKLYLLWNLTSNTISHQLNSLFASQTLVTLETTQSHQAPQPQSSSSSSDPEDTYALDTAESADLDSPHASNSTDADEIEVIAGNNSQDAHAFKWNISMISCGCESTSGIGGTTTSQIKSLQGWFLSYEWTIPIFVFGLCTCCVCFVRLTIWGLNKRQDYRLKNGLMKISVEEDCCYDKCMDRIKYGPNVQVQRVRLHPKQFEMQSIQDEGVEEENMSEIPFQPKQNSSDAMEQEGVPDW